jgi:hypothetical protein
MKKQTPHRPRGSTLDAYRVALELMGLLHEPLLKLRKKDRELEAQARRSLQSIVHNIAEGEGKVGSTRREQARFDANARGRCARAPGLASYLPDLPAHGGRGARFCRRAPRPGARHLFRLIARA